MAWLRLFEPYRDYHPETQRYMRREHPRLFRALTAARLVFSVAVLVCAGLWVRILWLWVR